MPQVSAYSRVPELRAALLERQRALAAEGRIIMAGRDIGTVVLPDADLKVYLNASVEERARRRAEERGIDPTSPDGQAILAELRRRDELDSTRVVAPLRPADDARILNTDGNRFEDTVAMVVAEIRGAERRLAAASSAAPIEDDVTPLISGTALVARLFARAITRVRFEGALNSIPRDGPVILAANHISNADPVILGAWLTPRLGRRMHWLAKREIFDWPVVGWLARHGGIHPVDRSTADVEAFKLARRILDEGHPLFVFPEGTRSPDGVLQEAKDGVAMLALRTGAVIVPIGISGSDKVWPRGQKLPRPGGRVTVRVGEPFRLIDEFPDGAKGREAKAAATNLIMTRIAELLDPRHRGRYGTAGERPDTAMPAMPRMR